MTFHSRDRLNTRLPPILWRALRKLADSWGLSNDQAVRRLIADAGGVPALEPPEPRSEAIPRETLLDPYVPIKRS